MFCSDHRLPEAHDCEYQNIIYERQNPRRRDVPTLEERIYKSIFSRAKLETITTIVLASTDYTFYLRIECFHLFFANASNLFKIIFMFD